MPKYILVILEDDIIRETNFADCGLAQYYERQLRWVISEYRKAIDTIKDYLPNKAKNRKYPKIVWVSPSIHDNYDNNMLRKKFCKVIESLTKFNENMESRRINQGWDMHDNGIYLKAEQRFTGRGIQTYWDAVDAIVKNLDSYDSKPQNAEHQSRGFQGVCSLDTR